MNNKGRDEKNMKNPNCIIFVAEMRNPNTNASSTQIMTNNLLYGFKLLCKELIFIPVISDEDDARDIREFYSPLCTEIFFLKQKTTFERNLILRQLSMYKEAYAPSKYVLPEGLSKYLKENTVIVSQSPTIDTILVSRQIKLNHSGIRYIQYWGDPMALSGIIIEEYNIKRILLKAIERQVHKYADKIVFGTESLFREQIKLFPEISCIATFCDVAYNPQSKGAYEGAEEFICGYFGNYYSSIRNIVPLYNAFASINNCKLVICGSTDLDLKSTNNVTIMKRIPQSRVEMEEAKTNIEICILNRVSAQIPGKLFYHTNTDKPIIVILDGPRAKSIRTELKRSHRFVFCDNDEVSIQKTLSEIIKTPIRTGSSEKDYYSPSRVCGQILS